MKQKQTVLLEYGDFPYRSYKPLPNATHAEKIKYLLGLTNPEGRLLLALVQYLQQYTKYFDKIDFVINYEKPGHYPNGTMGGFLKKINGSEIDVRIVPMRMDENTVHRVDFSYPYFLFDYTFITGKPSYKPHIFGLFQTFSLPVWITLISVLFAMPIISYALLKRKYTFQNVSFHVFAILMKQSSVIIPYSLVKKILIYSWVVGAMILCLSHDSVILSFLSFPPLTKIKTLSDLALAVERGDCHVIFEAPYVAVPHWSQSKEVHLNILAEDILTNGLNYANSLETFFRESHKQNLAIILERRYHDIYSENFFMSEDRFLESMTAMAVRKGFCCKELIDSFVHKIMTAGLYFKYMRDSVFRVAYYMKRVFPDPETTNRKLTLTDLAPAFIVLLTGYFISFLVLIFEVRLGRKKLKSMKIFQKRKRGKVSDRTSV